MRAVSTCPAGVMGWSLGAPTQPSARTTQGSYFNRHGVLKLAPPGVLRPNYVYKNGIWVQDGWLREKQATNYVSNLLPAHGEVTTDILGTKTRVQLTTDFSYINPIYSGVSASCVLSAYVTVKGGSAVVRSGVGPNYYRSVEVDDVGNILFDDAAYAGHAGVPSAYYIGNGMYRLSFPRIDGFTAFGVTSANLWLDSTSGPQVTVTCELVQLEDGDTPTSLIPTNEAPVTRAAD